MKLFTKYRVRSLTNPKNHHCLTEGFAGEIKKYFTLNELLKLDCSLYDEKFLKQTRGENYHQEDMVLQGYSDGEWVTIKKVSLLRPKIEPASTVLLPQYQTLQ